MKSRGGWRTYRKGDWDYGLAVINARGQVSECYDDAGRQALQILLDANAGQFCPTGIDRRFKPSRFYMDIPLEGKA